jgi:DNA-binding LytR/AlgR family response regulator
MISTAIVEDEQSAYEILKDHLLHFQKDNGVEFEISYFSNSLSFLDEKKAYDLILLDIEMPSINGMDLAKKIRAKDSKVILIFITNMVQYAIKGYEVDALDYVLKPINYSRFSSLMKKTLRILTKNKEDEIVLKTVGGWAKVYLSTIYYLEISDHLLIYHTKQGDFEVWRSLAAAEEELPKESFVRCNHSTIVNLKFVVSTEKDVIYLTDKKIEIQISHGKKKDFLSKLNTYLGI